MPYNDIRATSQMSNLHRRINASRIAESIELLKQHLNEDDIASLISVLQAIVKSPQDSQLVAQLYEVFDGLDITQGAVLTYAPYLAVVLADAPFKNAD